MPEIQEIEVEEANDEEEKKEEEEPLGDGEQEAVDEEEGMYPTNASVEEKPEEGSVAGEEQPSLADETAKEGGVGDEEEAQSAKQAKNAPKGGSKQSEQ